VSTVANLYYLPSGPTPADPVALLASTEIDQVLRVLRTEFDIVLVETPPVLPIFPALGLARRVDGVVLVVMVGRTMRRSVTRAVESIVQSGAPVIGVVVNGVRPIDVASGAVSGEGFRGPRGRRRLRKVERQQSAGRRATVDAQSADEHELGSMHDVYASVRGERGAG
jgi:Mrp family chromosome partitioning ATPase